MKILTWMIIRSTGLKIFLFIFLITLSDCNKRESTYYEEKLLLMSGEISQNSVILQARIANYGLTIESDIPGTNVKANFEVSDNSEFKKIKKSAWFAANQSNDFIIKASINDLKAGSNYYWRVNVKKDSVKLKHSQIARFNTLPPLNSDNSVHFVMVSCMNFEKYYGIGRAAQGGKGSTVADPAEGKNRELGFPAFKTIKNLKPDFWISNGDNVYYDSPTERPELRAKSKDELRAKWHRQFSMPRALNLFSLIPVYWLKDDHDYRFNDADTTNMIFPDPSHELGIEIFKEQVPVVELNDQEQKTYRTYKINSLLQIWMVEGRDYRSPNKMPDGPEKSIWGSEQKKWLKRTLLKSDAVFKILISPTPLVGPDDAYKADNHTNPGGFRYERDEFFTWLVKNNFLNKNFFIITGDRHWQYHSIHPIGFEEFSSGALVTQNARKGRKPGDPESTDPTGLIDQPYIQEDPTGGFLDIKVEPSLKNKPEIHFKIVDEKGSILYNVSRTAK